MPTEAFLIRRDIARLSQRFRQSGLGILAAAPLQTSLSSVAIDDCHQFTIAVPLGLEVLRHIRGLSGLFAELKRELGISAEVSELGLCRWKAMQPCSAATVAPVRELSLRFQHHS